MKKLLFIFVFITLAVNLQAQGEIFTSAEADTLFGEVIESVTMHADTLKKILGIGEFSDTTLTKTEDEYNPLEINYYKIVDGQLIIMDDTRTTQLTKTNVLLKADDVAYGITKEMIDELIFQSGSNIVTFQLRANTYPMGKGLFKMTAEENVFTIGSAELVVERAEPCPPICSPDKD